MNDSTGFGFQLILSKGICIFKYVFWQWIMAIYVYLQVHLGLILLDNSFWSMWGAVGIIM